MNSFTGVFSLFAILFVCTLDGYSMMNYRVPTKRAYVYFAAVTALCLIINSYIAVRWGSETLRMAILFTIGLPYFLLILLITNDKISQTVFNFWLWINVYGIISNFSAFIDDYTFKNEIMLTFLRLAMFLGYFVIYNRVLKKMHRRIMDKLDVNWWIFSFIPMFFTLLIYIINLYFKDFYGHTRNYPILLVVHILMLLVYILMFYTFKTVSESMEKQNLAQSMKEQVALQKKQYEFYRQKAETERIFRHDARHRADILLNYLEIGSVDKAKALIKKELDYIQKNTELGFCSNTIVNAVLSEYFLKAKRSGIEFSAQIQMPQNLACDETEFCVMLSNFIENSLDAAKSYISVTIKPLNKQLSLNIKNDFDGEIKKDSDGEYVTTKPTGSGFGIKSANAILKLNGGFLKIDDTGGVFNVFATLKN